MSLQYASPVSLECEEHIFFVKLQHLPMTEPLQCL